MTTPIEWLIDKFENEYGFNFGVFEKELIEKSKEIEKEQMLSIINFVRKNNKMSKSVEDLFQEYNKTHEQ